MKVKINSKVVNDKVAMNIKALQKAFKQFNGKDITITIEKKRKKRSTMQNSYYWAVIVSLVQLAIKDAWGEVKTNDEVHELLKTNCNYIERVNEDTGEWIKDPKSTTENSTSEQEEFHAQCRLWAYEWFGIDIPLPNEQIEIEIN